MSANLAKTAAQLPEGVSDGNVSPTGKRRKQYANAAVPAGLPDHFFNDEGEVDLSKVTGAEAYKYFMMQGVKLPMIFKDK